MSSKRFVDAQSLLEDSYCLALKILQGEFRPTFIIGLWRGGAPPGIAVQELLEYCGVNTDHIGVRTSSYVNMVQQKEIRIHGLEYIVNTVKETDSLLLVDDVFDTGNSVAALLNAIRTRCAKPKEIRIATVYYKPTKNLQTFAPDYYIHESNEWLVFPHELVGLSPEEVLKKGIDLKQLRERVSEGVPPL